MNENKKEQTLEEKWENATIANNFIFYKVMRNNPDICKELPERSRYYQGVIDVDLLKSGQKYKDLKTSFVIFICVDDIFEKGRAKYTFENLCAEDPKIKLNDRAYKYFFISKNCDKMLNERQKAFLRMVTENKSSDDFTDRIKTLVADAKRNTQWRKQFMEWEREKTYIREDAIEEGRQQKAVEDARKFLADGKYTAEEISDLLGIPVEAFAEQTTA